MDSSSRNTLFVRGIPPSATSKQLELFFSDFGPIRSCFVVADQTDQVKNRGFGFVQFADTKDAEQAVQKAPSMLFMNTKLQVEFAKRRSRLAESSISVIDGNPVKDRPRSRVKAVWKRVVMISGINGDVDRKKVYKKLSKFGRVCSLMYPATLPQQSLVDLPERLMRLFKESHHGNSSIEGDDENEQTSIVMDGVAYALYLNECQANEAYKRLNNHVFKGSRISASICPNPVVAKQDSRLIVRNLPFDCSSDQLGKVFRPYGFLLEISIPQSGGKSRGFAFVTLSSRKEAENAIEALNETKPTNFKRTIIVDWALAKESYVSLNVQPIQQTEAVSGDEPISEPAVADEPENHNKPPECQMEVDVSPEDSCASDSLEIDEVDHGCDSDDFPVEFDDSVETQYQKRTKLDSDLCSTLFIKNIAFESTEEDLIELFKPYGPLNYCKITINGDTGKSKGTGFIQFANKSDAENLLKDVERGKITVGAPMMIDRKNPLLVPESSDGLWLHGRQLLVMPAMDRKDAENKKRSDSEMFKQKDKRNTYLLKEGFIRSDSQAAKNLAPVELNRRQQSYYDRKRQLERFPHLFVSTTRLSIRNLPKHIDDHELKKLANSAVIGYRDRLTAQFNDGSLGKSEKQEYRHLVDDEQLMMTVRVKQAKVIRDQSKTDRVSSETAAAKPVNVSKGYGFVEFTRHSHALACLRHLNNNPDIFGGNRRLLVEFAIENSQILKRRQTRTMPPANFMDVKQKDTTTTGKERPIAKAKGDKLAQSQCHRKLSSPQDLERTQKQAPKRKRPVAIDDFDILVAKYKNRLASDPQSTSAVNNRWS